MLEEERKSILAIQKLDDGHIIRFIDKNYSGTIRIKIRKLKQYYIKTPVETDDLYNIFLAEIPAIVRKFNFTINFRVFIAIQTHYTVRNILRKYTSNKYRVLNNYVPYDNVSFLLKDSQESSDVDLSVLNDIEFDVLTSIMLNSEKIIHFALRKNLTIYIVRKIISQIKLKLKKQFL